MNRLKELRLSKKLTIRSLAAKIGVSHSQITHIENGQRNFTTANAIKFASFFGVSIDYLLGINIDAKKITKRRANNMNKLTVNKLIEFLKTQNQNALVGLSCDSEGNSYSLIADECFYVDKVFLKNVLGTQDTYFEEEEIANAKDGKIADYFGNETAVADLKESLILFGTN